MAQISSPMETNMLDNIDMEILTVSVNIGGQTAILTLESLNKV